MLAVIIMAMRYLFLLMLLITIFRLVKWMIADLRQIADNRPIDRPASRQNPPAAAIERGKAGLLVMEGDRDTLQKGDSIACDQGELLIGRSERSDVVIAGSYASARHARLYCLEGQYWLEDLHSTNGTYLNDNQVIMPVVLANGDIIRIGNVTFQFVRWAYEMGADH